MRTTRIREMVVGTVAAVLIATVSHAASENDAHKMGLTASASMRGSATVARIDRLLPRTNLTNLLTKESHEGTPASSDYLSTLKTALADREAMLGMMSHLGDRWPTKVVMRKKVELLREKVAKAGERAARLTLMAPEDAQYCNRLGQVLAGLEVEEVEMWIHGRRYRPKALLLSRIAGLRTKIAQAEREAMTAYAKNRRETQTRLSSVSPEDAHAQIRLTAVAR
jgi:hypothetical protein